MVDIAFAIVEYNDFPKIILDDMVGVVRAS
jgi:hypothetical protein